MIEVFVVVVFFFFVGGRGYFVGEALEFNSQIKEGDRERQRRRGLLCEMLQKREKNDEDKKTGVFVLCLLYY